MTVIILPKADDEEAHVDAAIPALQLQIRDLKHVGAERFLTAVNATRCMTTAVENILGLLYGADSKNNIINNNNDNINNSSNDINNNRPRAQPPPVKSVSLILEDMPGVAYTFGQSNDRSIKEIHFSVRHIASTDPSRVADEITGVLTHELVHCFQHDARGTAPSGLIEGVADWVRLRCRLAPPHWQEVPGDRWDAGYQHTAYFLDYLERRFGAGTVKRINARLRDREYDEKSFWEDILGGDVGELYKEYVATLVQRR